MTGHATHDEMCDVLGRLYAPRNLALHERLSWASSIQQGMSLMTFCSEPRSLHDYHRMCLLWLSARPWAVENDFLSALHRTLDEMWK